jgi:hypothetical protein
MQSFPGVDDRRGKHGGDSLRKSLQPINDGGAKVVRDTRTVGVSYVPHLPTALALP